MTTIQQGAEILQKAIDSGQVKPAAVPTSYPPPDPAPTLNSLMRTPMPAKSVRDADTVRQFYNQAMPQTRLLPQINGDPAVGAQAASQTITIVQSGNGSLLLETNSQKNALQSTLNLLAGSNVQLSSDAFGGVTIAGTATGDGLTHGDVVWEYDSAYVLLRDDFVPFLNTTVFSNTFPTAGAQIGELGWALAGTISGTQAPLFYGGYPPYIGQFVWTNTSTTADQFAGLFLNQSNETSTGKFQHNSFALLENPGWKMTWIFKFDGDIPSSAPPTTPTFRKTGFYIGLAGSAILGIGGAGAGNSARPDMFIGLRYDTSTTPAGMAVTSVAAGTGVYTGVFGGGATNGFAGQNITFKGFAQAANNGTFACTASTGTTLTVSNGASATDTTGIAVAASLPLSAAGNASGGNTTYTMLTGLVGFGTNGLTGISFVVSGFTNGANNGTFTCVSNTATALVLNNAGGVAETKAAFATGGTINDAFFTFEAVENQQYSTQVRKNKQGQTLVTSIAPVIGAWHRLDLVCTAVGVVTLTLDGSATNTVSFTIPTMSFTSNGSATVGSNGKTAQVQTVTGPSGVLGYPSFGAGSSVTFSGFSGGNAAMNGTFILESMTDVSGSPYFNFPLATVIAGNTSQIPTSTGFPALTPFITFGNDNTASPTTSGIRFFVDYFSLVWNPNLGPTAPGTPDKTKPRYW